MKVIDGSFGKTKIERPTSRLVFERILAEEGLDNLEDAMGIATAGDGTVVFSSNMDLAELYMLLDQIKMFILSGAEDFE